jgi:endonuclease YncB( thermonuclease family)
MQYFTYRLTYLCALLLVTLAAWLPGQAVPLRQEPGFPAQGAANTNANLRAGPGTAFARVGGVKAGDVLEVVGCEAGCTWYKLDSGSWISAALVDLGGSLAAAAKAGPPAGAVAAQVTAITDGDTITVRMGGKEYKLRYILINTPETDQPLGAEATAANRALVLGKTVYLVKDVSETDRYGRLLRYVYLADGTFVNAELVRQGWAQVATFPPDVAKEAEMRAAQQEAAAAGRGLWSGGAGAAGGQGQRTGTAAVPPGPAATPAPPPAATPSLAAAATPSSAAPPVPASASGAGLLIVAVNKGEEYVDIRNLGAGAVDLGGWVLHSEKGSQDCALRGRIAPGETLRIYAMTGDGGFSCGFDSNIWNNSEPDAAVLWSPEGVAVSRYLE